MVSLLKKSIKHRYDEKYMKIQKKLCSFTNRYYIQQKNATLKDYYKGDSTLEEH